MVFGNCLFGTGVVVCLLLRTFACLCLVVYSLFDSGWFVVNVVFDCLYLD